MTRRRGHNYDSCKTTSFSELPRPIITPDEEIGRGVHENLQDLQVDFAYTFDGGGRIEYETR